MFVLATLNWKDECYQPEVFGVYATEEEANKVKDAQAEEDRWRLQIIDLEELRIRLKDVRETIARSTQRLEAKIAVSDKRKADLAQLDTRMADYEKKHQRAVSEKGYLQMMLVKDDHDITIFRQRLKNNRVVLAKLEKEQQLLLSQARTELQEQKDAMSILDAYARNMALQQVDGRA